MSDFANDTRAMIRDIAKNGGRIEIAIGPAVRTMTFKPGFTVQKVDQLIAMMTFGLEKELNEKAA
jgi:hypothetical protein